MANIIIKKFFFIFLIIISVTSCASRLNKEYELLKASGIPKDELIVMIQDFDKAHYRFLDSKLDLGLINLLNLNYDKAFEYFNRALALMESGEKCTEEQKAILFSSLSTLYIEKKDIETAERFARRAWSSGRAGKVYGYLYGRILYSVNKKEEALKVFDKTYKKFPEKLDKDSLRTYMYLLAETDNFEQCRLFIELNAGKGWYFENFGTFASQIYERTGELEQAVYYSCLEYFFTPDKTEKSDSDFLNNLEKLEAILKSSDLGGRISPDKIEAALSAVAQIKALLKKDAVIPPACDNFVSRYIFYKHKFIINNLDFEDYKKLAELEPWFCNLKEFYEILLTESSKFLSTNNPAVQTILRQKIKKLDGQQ